MSHLQGNQQARSQKIAVITSRFNWEVTGKLEEGARQFFQEIGYDPKNLTYIRVPGAFEIPLAAKYCIDKGFHAVVALGAVIRGDTSHYDYVCSAVERGCTELQIRHAVPVAFGILTTENEEQAFARAGGNMGNKGREAAEVAVEMLNLQQSINTEV